MPGKNGRKSRGFGGFSGTRGGLRCTFFRPPGEIPEGVPSCEAEFGGGTDDGHGVKREREGRGEEAFGAEPGGGFGKEDALPNGRNQSWSVCVRTTSFVSMLTSDHFARELDPRGIGNRETAVDIAFPPWRRPMHSRCHARLAGNASFAPFHDRSSFRLCGRKVRAECLEDAKSRECGLAPPLL